jgi:4-hydroxythreonine-4-phosphate dehydrogenase
LITGESALAGWRFALTNFRKALQFARDGLPGAIAFTPFNKHATRLFESSFFDEIEIIGAELGGGPGRKVNVLDHLWNARITSHVPLSKVASLITVQ